MGLQAEIVARLRDQAMPPLAMVEAAASPQAAIERPPEITPAAYVLWADDSPSPNRLSGKAVRQTVESTWSVMVAIRNVADGRGGASSADFDAVREAIRDALLGFQPPSAAAPFQYAAGGFAGTDDDSTWFQLSYTTMEVISA